MTNSWYDEVTTQHNTRRFAMAQNEYTTNRKYRHLTREKRAQIEVLLQLKLPKSRIAREVGIARVRTESEAIHALL